MHQNTKLKLRGKISLRLEADVWKPNILKESIKLKL